MWTCGSMKPGNTILPAASMISVPGGASRPAPIRVMVSFSIQISPINRESAFTMSAFRMSNGIGVRLTSIGAPAPLRWRLRMAIAVGMAVGSEMALVNFDSHFSAIFLHRFPVFGRRAMRVHQLVPRYGLPLWRQFYHLDAVFHRTHVIAKAATHAVFFSHS